MTAHFKDGMELRLLCDLTVVLNIAAFLRLGVVLGKGFGSKCKTYFTWKMAAEYVRSLFAVFRCFFVQLPAYNFPKEN